MGFEGEDALRMPLTAAQMGIWLGQHMNEDNPLYWTAEAVELHGAHDAMRLQRAVANVMRSCETLNMRIACDECGHPYQYPCAGEQDIERLVPIIDCSSAPDPEQAAWQWMRNAHPVGAMRWDQPLYATAVLILDRQRCIWYLRTHHVVMDGYAYSLVLNQVADAYAADRFLPPQCATLAEIVQEDQHDQSSSACAASRDFWSKQLSNARHEPGTLRPFHALSNRVIHAESILDQVEKQLVQQAAQCLGLDWVSYLIGLYAAWQMALLGRKEIRIGLPVMARLGSVSVATPCMRMNIVPLTLCRQQADGAWFDGVKQTLKNIRPHQNYRYESMKEDLRSASSDAPIRLLGSVVNIMPFEKRVRWADLHAVYHVLHAGPVEDLSMNVIPKQGGLSFEWYANSNTYTSDDLNALNLQMLAIIREHAKQVCARSDKCLSNEEALFAWLSAQTHVLSQQFILDADCEAGESLELQDQSALSILHTEPLWDVDSLSFEKDDVLVRIEAQVKTQPNHMAVCEVNGSGWSYAQLWQAVQAQTAMLQEAGVLSGHRVMLILPRRLSTVATILAVLSIGASYIPLDPDTPILRVQQILDDEGTDVIVAPPDTRLYAQLQDAKPNTVRILSWDEQPIPHSNVPVALSEQSDWRDSPAYTIYTSGSTGRPNGVMISRASLAHFVHSANANYQITAQDRVLQFAPLHFDASVEELFVTLCHGATLVLRHENMLDSMTAFTDSCIQLGITVLDLPTAFWHEWVYGLERLSHGEHALRLVIVGGEAVLVDKLHHWQAQVRDSVRLLNSYGPTETTVICTLADLSAYDAERSIGAMPIGRPLAGLQAVVLNEQDQVVSQGVEGELCVTGPTVGLGYWRRDEVTAKRFITTDRQWLAELSTCIENPLYAVTYRTGDRVRLGKDGQLYYLGRLDDELKISGHRIDPSEVENALLTHPYVQQAVVLGLDSGGGSKHLAAFCVLRAIAQNEAGEDDVTVASPALIREWKNHLGRLLAEAAIPQLFFVLEQLPLNANNKIDRKNLAMRAQTYISTQSNVSGEQSISQLQGMVRQTWSEVLGLPDIGIQQNFFEVGGKSLQAIQVANRLRQKLQQNLSISALFRYPTIEQLSAYLANDLAYHPPQDSDMFAPILCLHAAESIDDSTAEASNLFCLHPAEGLAWCYMGLAKQLPEFNIYGLQNPFINQSVNKNHSSEIPDQSSWVEAYVRAILSVQRHGEYHLLGWSSGGGMAHAVACRLQALGHEVRTLAVLDAYPSETWLNVPEPTMMDAWQALLDVTGDSSYLQHLDELSVVQIQHLLRSSVSPFSGLSLEQCERLSAYALQQMRLYRSLKHPKFSGDMMFFQALDVPAHAPVRPQVSDWQRYIDGEICTHGIQCQHVSMCRPLPLSQIGERLAQYIGARSVHPSE